MDHRRFGVRSLLLGFVLALGAWAVWLVGTGIGGEWISAAIESPSEALWFSSKFGPFIKTEDAGSFPSRQYLNLDREPITLGPDPWEDPGRLDLYWGIGARSSGGITSFPACNNTRDFWYLVDAGMGEAYFVGYDTSTNEPFGYLGPEGFTPHLPTRNFAMATGQINSRSVSFVNSFYGHYACLPLESADRAQPVYVNTGDKVYEVELCGRSVRTVYSDERHPILTLGSMRVATDGRARNLRRDLVLRTDDSVVILKDGSAPSATIPIPTELRSMDLRCFVMPNGDCYLYAGILEPEELYLFDSEGKLQWKRKLDLKSGTVIPESIAAVTLMPIPSLFVTMLPMMSYIAPLPGRDGWSTLVERWMNYQSAVVLLLGLSMLLAIATYLRLSGYGGSRSAAIAWGIFVFLFGMPGYLGFRLHRSWPAGVVLRWRFKKQKVEAATVIRKEVFA